MVTKVVLGLILMVSLLFNVKQRFVTDALNEKVDDLQAKYKAVREYVEYLSNRKSRDNKKTDPK